MTVTVQLFFILSKKIFCRSHLKKGLYRPEGLPLDFVEIQRCQKPARMLFFEIAYSKNPWSRSGLLAENFNRSSVLLICMLFAACSGAASFQDSLLPVLDADAYLLPSDLLFRKDLETGGYRLPADTVSALPLKDSALQIPLVFDGFSPRSLYYIPLPCDLREDLIPEKDFDGLFLYDMSYRRRVPVSIRYRNKQNCGLIVRPRRVLEMDRTYALVVLNSYVWQDRLHQPKSLGRLFDRLRSEREDTPELEALAASFGLRARETRQVLDQLRLEGIPSSRILRLGIAAVRSIGGLYGPYFAMLRRYQLEEDAEIVSMTRFGPGLFRLHIRLRSACSETPCRLQPVAGPGVLAPSLMRKGPMLDREVLIRFPENPARAFLWLEDADAKIERNRMIFEMPVFSQIAEDAQVVIAMFLRTGTSSVNDRIASIIEKNAVSRLLQSYQIEELQACKERCRPQKQTRRMPVLQLCLTEGDCAASAALDPEISAVILPVVDDELPRVKFENGRLPSRQQIIAGYARDLCEDLLSLELSRQMMMSKRIPFMQKKVHVTENLFHRSQYESLIEFIRNHI